MEICSISHRAIIDGGLGMRAITLPCAGTEYINCIETAAPSSVVHSIRRRIARVIASTTDPDRICTTPLYCRTRTTGLPKYDFEVLEHGTVRRSPVSKRSFKR